MLPQGAHLKRPKYRSMIFENACINELPVSAYAPKRSLSFVRKAYRILDGLDSSELLPAGLCVQALFRIQGGRRKETEFNGGGKL